MDKWILCKEKLPKEIFGCLVTIAQTNLITGEDFESIYNGFVGYDGERWNTSDGVELPFEVIAWMPLPQPCKIN